MPFWNNGSESTGKYFLRVMVLAVVAKEQELNAPAVAVSAFGRSGRQLSWPPFLRGNQRKAFEEPPVQVVFFS